MNYSTRPRYSLVLALLLVLAAYFQSIGNPFSRFDDPFIVNHFGINSSISFIDVILPGGGFYFRPLISVSYWLDSKLWGMDPTFMHLENIVVHLINVSLVFLITSRLPIASHVKVLPLLTALLFGLHPINSEPVNWIAGRTDPIAGMFIFLAVYYLIRGIQECSYRFVMFAYLIACMGMLAKETAIMFIPAGLFLTAFWPISAEDVSSSKSWRNRFLVIPAVFASLMVISLLALVYVKGHGNSALSLVLEGGTDILERSLEAFGFYIKKMIVPLPLNVAIVKVHPIYVLFGVLTLCAAVVTFRRGEVPGVFLIMAALFILPALIVAVTPIAWTPFGERYLYIPSAFAVIGGLELIHRFSVKWNLVNWFVPTVCIIIITAAVITVRRSVVWGSNFALIQDTVLKSPDFGVARNEYGALLIQGQRYDEAEKQFRIALEKNNQRIVNKVIRHNLIGVRIHGKPPSDARLIILAEIGGNKANGDVELLKLLYSCDESILGGTVRLADKKRVVAEMQELNEYLFLKTHEPHYLYRSGQLALIVDCNKQAAQYFNRAWRSAPADAYYREPAKRLAEKLGTK